MNRHDDALGFSEIIPDDTGNMTIRGLPETTRRLDVPATVYVREEPKSDEPKQIGPKQLSLF